MNEQNEQNIFPSKPEPNHRKKRPWLIICIILLFIILILTSLFAGFLLGRYTGSTQGGEIIDTIVIKPTPAPEKKPVGVSGRILYSDGTPYANGRVQLHSDPKETKTDENGFFHFEDVEAGVHTIFILDHNGGILAESRIELKRDSSEKDVAMVKNEDGSYVVNIAAAIQNIELILKIGNDGESMNLVTVKSAETPSGVTPSPSPTNSVSPTATTSIASAAPTAKPSVPPSTVPTAEPDGKFEVEGSTDGQTWTQNVFVDLFKNRVDNITGTDAIAPGSKGYYRFRLQNQNAFAITFTISARENFAKSFHLPLRFRITDSTGKTAYAGWAETNSNGTNAVTGKIQLAAGASSEYRLEWEWPYSTSYENDRYDTQAALNGNAYIVDIEICLEQV